MNPFYILFLIAVFMLIWCFIAYNALIRSRALTDEAWRGIRGQLKRRFDLIPQLAEAVKDSTKEQTKAVENIIQLRNKAIYTSPFDVSAQARASAALSEGLQTVFTLSENDFNVKASPAFMQLRTTWVQIEADLQSCCNDYNAAVRDYNAKCDAFPSNLSARLLQLTKKTDFELASTKYAKNAAIPY